MKINLSDSSAGTPKCLFVCIQPFEGICNGGGAADKRCYELAKQTFGDNFDYYYVNKKGYNSSVFKRLVGYCYGMFGYLNGLTPKIIQELLNIAGSYDTIFICSSLYGVLAKKLRENGYQGKIIVHFHNIEAHYFDVITSPNAPMRRRKLEMVEWNEKQACKYADSIIVLNNRDAKCLAKLYGRESDLVMNLTMEDKLPSRTLENSSMTSSVPNCLFVGSYFPPNVDGILWFVKNVMPNVNISLTIAGREMYRIKSKLPLDMSIKVESDVENLTELYTSADFMLFPIFEGSGMKVKTCEALMYGKNILATDEALEGYDVDAKRIGARCNSADDYIQALNEFCKEPIPRFNLYSREHFLSHHTNNVALSLFRQLFDRQSKES